ncbi:unnamed protein product, partial [Rotaria magnacalcarata]
VLLFALPVLSFIRRLPACNPEVGDPIIVHCLAVVDTVLNKICEHLSLTTFYALYAIIEQMKLEGRLNIYVLAKLYHIRRSGIWQHN